jgi:hypothetical protein
MLDVINEIAKYIKYFLDCLEVCEYFIVNKCNADVVNVLNIAPFSSAIFIIISHTKSDYSYDSQSSLVRQCDGIFKKKK